MTFQNISVSQILSSYMVYLSVVLYLLQLGRASCVIVTHLPSPHSNDIPKQTSSSMVKLRNKPNLHIIDEQVSQYEELIKSPYEYSVEKEIGNDNNWNSYSSNEVAGRADSSGKKVTESNKPISWLQNPGILAAIICSCLVVGLLLILLAVFCIYRLRKRDEGSYALDEPKKMLPPSAEYNKAPTREFYA